MDRYWQANTAPEPPTVPDSNAGGYPCNGSPNTGVKGTVPGAWWYHVVTEEVRNVLTAHGVTPDFQKTGQLAEALANALATLSKSINYDELQGAPDLAKVATSGAYDDLSGAPEIPAAQVNADWNADSGVAMIENRPALADVATSGAYADLSGTPEIPPAQVNADWNAESGAAMIENKPALAKVATSGEYGDLSDPPTIPAPQVNADWYATSGVAMILNKPASFKGPLSGLYVDLSYQPNLRGIDMGDHYELDFSIGTTAFGGFEFTANEDHSITVPAGLYLVNADAEVSAPMEDDWQLPAQVVFSVWPQYAFPGHAYVSVQRYPDLPLATQKINGRMGSIILAGAMPLQADDHLWAGFSKVTGPSTPMTLFLRGGLTIIKVA